MASRKLNESTQAWLERLIAIDASETIIKGVTAILQRETAGNISKYIQGFNKLFYVLISSIYFLMNLFLIILSRTNATITNSSSSNNRSSSSSIISIIR
jgi:hypothetical protein